MKIVVFDFDDTLFATTEINNQKNIFDRVFKELSKSILSLLDEAVKRSNKVLIITNAESSWVKLCTEKLLPGCELFMSKFDVISTVDAGFGDVPVRYRKSNVFRESLLSYFNAEGKHELISFGDCPFDRRAARLMASDNINVKTIKFAHRPTLEQLLSQQELIKSCFDHIFSHPGPLDLVLTITLVQPSTGMSTMQKSSSGDSGKSGDSGLDTEPIFEMDL